MRENVIVFLKIQKILIRRVQVAITRAPQVVLDSFKTPALNQSNGNDLDIFFINKIK